MFLVFDFCRFSRWHNTGVISGSQISSQLLQNTEKVKQTDVLLWKIWRKYRSVSYLFSSTPAEQCSVCGDRLEHWKKQYNVWHSVDKYMPNLQKFKMLSIPESKLKRASSVHCLSARSLTARVFLAQTKGLHWGHIQESLMLNSLVSLLFRGVGTHNLKIFYSKTMWLHP